MPAAIPSAESSAAANAAAASVGDAGLVSNRRAHAEAHKAFVAFKAAAAAMEAAFARLLEAPADCVPGSRASEGSGLRVGRAVSMPGPAVQQPAPTPRPARAPAPPARRSDTGGRPLCELSLLIIEMAGRPEGVALGDVAGKTGRPAEEFGYRFRDLMLRGRVVRRKLPKLCFRYFTGDAAADAWVGRQNAPPPAPQRAPKLTTPDPKPRTVAQQKAGWSSEAPPLKKAAVSAATVSPHRPTGEVIVPETVKITRAATPVDSRFYVDPAAVAKDSESFSAQWARLRGQA
jgi:hypothetical protein